MAEANSPARKELIKWGAMPLKSIINLQLATKERIRLINNLFLKSMHCKYVLVGVVKSMPSSLLSYLSILYFSSQSNGIDKLTRRHVL
jgi:hypothetical protein